MVEIGSLTFVPFLGHTLFSTSTSNISLPIWLKLGVVNSHAVSFRSCGLCENRLTVSLAVTNGAVKFLPILSEPFIPLKKKVWYRRCQQQFVECVSPDCRRSGSHTSVMDVKEFFSFFFPPFSG